MFIQHLRVAKMSEDEIKKILPWEVRGQLPIDPSHALMRHIIAGDVHQDQEPKSEVILLAAARSFVEQLLAAAAKAKLDVIGMNVEPKAIIDCFTAIYRRKVDASATSMFIDIGCGSTLRDHRAAAADLFRPLHPHRRRSVQPGGSRGAAHQF